MRVVLAAVGSLGDVYPMVGFGLSLLKRGHSVAVITTPSQKAPVTDAGLDYLELCDAEDEDELTRQFFRMIDFRLVLSQQQGPLDKINAATARITELFEAERESRKDIVCLVSMHSDLLLDRGWFRRASVPMVLLWHSVYTLYLWTRAVRNPVKNLSIALFPRWFVPWYEDGERNVVFSSFPLYQGRVALRPEVEDFLAAGKPPVIFSSTSWEPELVDYFHASVDACNTLELRGMLLHQTVQDLAAGSPNVIDAGYVPLGAVLPRAEALVHHGGFGTIAAALAAGTPQIVVPWNSEQPYNGKHLDGFGVSIRLRRLDYRNTITPALERLLASKEIRARCAEIKSRIPETPDFDEAIARLEALV